MKLDELIHHHLRASGPVTFNSIMTYVGAQYMPAKGEMMPQMHEVASILTQLIRDNKAWLYDTGDSFDA